MSKKSDEDPTTPKMKIKKKQPEITNYFMVMTRTRDVKKIKKNSKKRKISRGEKMNKWVLFWGFG